MTKGKVVLGMSGGVDSSVAAYLLKEQGYEVIGVTMEIWQPLSEEEQQMEGGCCGLSAVEDARRVAAELQIPYYVMNFRDIFREKVIHTFINEYLNARTPNPCILCNRFVKWEALLNRSLAMGADFIATGHYAKVVKLEEDLYKGNYTNEINLTGNNNYTNKINLTGNDNYINEINFTGNNNYINEINLTGNDNYINEINFTKAAAENSSFSEYKNHECHASRDCSGSQARSDNCRTSSALSSLCLRANKRCSSAGRYAIKKSITKKKDQTYALYNLTQKQLSHTLMPIGDYTKEEVRDIAKRKGLPVAEKPDSQEICFVPDQDYAGFIHRETDHDIPEGNFIDKDGNILGRHKGIVHYTIGQRKGLQLSLGKPVYVSKLLPETNEVVVGDETEVFTNVIYCNDLNHMAVPRFPTKDLVTAKIRYGSKEAPCHIEYLGEDKCKCTFEEDVRAAAPGQAIVFYHGDIVLGGGTILG